jgi:hypothetical protein
MRKVNIEVPCNIGDEVYFICTELAEVCKAKVVTIILNYYCPSNPITIEIEYESKQTGKHTVKMWDNVFDLLCFYTEQDAKEKLEYIIQLDN